MIEEGLSYPPVAGEFETIERCLEGYSLSRYGDGELKILYGGGYSREPPNNALTAELHHVFMMPYKNCIVGIPTMDPRGPKYEFTEMSNGNTNGWWRHKERFARLLALSEVRKYYSAFVTRPDSAPWIRNIEYATLLERLWKGKNAAVVCEKKNKIFDAVRLNAKSVKHIRCPSKKAYAKINELELACTESKADIVIISAGPTATALANRLSRDGMHAIDLGSCGGWISNLLRGKQE